MKAFDPCIKWSGSKRSQSEMIISHFPDKIETYYEPFCGGCSVLRRLLSDDSVSVGRYVCSDTNNDLISLWNAVKERPSDVISRYDELWREMNSTEDRSFKRKFFEKVRDKFNKDRDPLDFMFIMRTTTNGMPRYNSNGDFNNSFHITRNGITPDKLCKIVEAWSLLLRNFDVEFICQSFETIYPKKKDYAYLDPPYAHTKGMYSGKFDNSKLFEWMGMLKCGYALSYDGISGKEDNTYEVPESLYDLHIYLKSGNSSFKRTIGKSKDSIVYESLYLKMGLFLYL